MNKPVKIANHNHKITMLSDNGESFGTGISLPLSHKPKVIDEAERIVLFCLNAGNWVKRYYWDSDTASVKHYWIKPINNEKSIDDSKLRNGISILDSHNVFTGISGTFGVAGEHFTHNGMLFCYSRFHKDEKITPVWEQVKEGTIRFNSMGSWPMETVGVEDSDGVWWYEYRVHQPDEQSLCHNPADHDSFSMSEAMISKYNLGV